MDGRFVMHFVEGAISSRGCFPRWTFANISAWNVMFCFVSMIPGLRTV